MHLGLVYRTIFSFLFKFDGKLVLVLLHCKVSYRYKISQMPQQHSFRDMCKILQWSFHYNMDDRKLKLPSNLIYEGKNVREMGPCFIVLCVAAVLSAEWND